MTDNDKKKLDLDPNPDSLHGASQEYVEAWHKKYDTDQQKANQQLAADREEAARQQREGNAPTTATGTAAAEGESK